MEKIQPHIKLARRVAATRRKWESTFPLSTAKGQSRNYEKWRQRFFFCNATLRISSQPLIVFCKPDYPTGLISLIPASTWHEKIPADC